MILIVLQKHHHYYYFENRFQEVMSESKGGNLWLVNNTGLPWRLSGKESACQCRRCGFDPWVGKILCSKKWQPTLVSLPGKSHEQRTPAGYSTLSCRRVDRRRQQQPTPVLLPGKSHGWRSLVGYSPWGREESEMTERVHFRFSLSCIGEENGNPLQCSCLENPRNGGAWWAALYLWVAQSRTRLKRLSSSSSSSRQDLVAKQQQTIQERDNNPLN